MVAPVMRALGPPDMKMHTMSMPHLMFYAPNITNEDIGAAPNLSDHFTLLYPFIDKQGIAEQSCMIQLIGQGDRGPHLRRDAMVTWLMRRAIGAFERTWNYDARYLYDILEASPRAARLFWRVASLGQYRRDIPIEAWAAAGITAVRHEDCGPCTPRRDHGRTGRRQPGGAARGAEGRSGADAG